MYALDLLTAASEHPECDELFARTVALDHEQFRAMVEKMRSDRASWGTTAREDET